MSETALAARVTDAADDLRRRAARRLHDGPQQQFVTAAVSLQLAGHAWDDDPQRARALVEEALERVQAGLAGLRSLAAELHPAILTTHGLAAAIDGWAARVDVLVDVVDHLGERRLPDRVEVGLYAAVIDALGSVPDRAGVELSAEGASAVVDLRSSGARLSAGAADRVEVLGGVCSTRAGGLRIEVPLTD